MTTINPSTLPIAVLDGHLLSDDAIRRLAARGATITSFRTGSHIEHPFDERVSSIAPGLPVEDGGQVANVREAIVECARRRIIVLTTGTPVHADRFVAQCLQGAAAATQFDVPAIAVQVVRERTLPGTVAWLTDTGELSGYGVLFAVGYAGLRGTGVELIEPAGGMHRPRTPEAIDEALAQAERAGIPVTRHTDPSPLARALRDEHCIVVHPVLDAPAGLNLLHPGELPPKSVRTGNPAAVVELIERFEGDVVAVYDGVLLIGSSINAGRIAAAATLGVIGIAGLGTVAAAPAMADSHHAVTHEHATANEIEVLNSVPGVTHVATPHGHGGTTLTLHNTTDHDITVQVEGGHGHGGSLTGVFEVRIPAHGYQNLTVDGGIKQWIVAPGAQHHVQAPHVSIGGTATTSSTLATGPQVEMVMPTTETELEHTDAVIPMPPALEFDPPSVTATSTPQFSVQGHVVVSQPPMVAGHQPTEATIATPTPQGPSTQGTVVTPPLPQPTIDQQAPVVTPPAQGPSTQGTVVTPPLPQPTIEEPDPVSRTVSVW